MSHSVKTFKNEDYRHYENWLRLVVLIDSTGRKLCYEILHKIEKLPEDGAELYSRLQEHKDRVHYQIYEEILCPSDKIIDESKFDLLVYMTVICYMFGVKYQKRLQDINVARNKIFHMDDLSICSKNFEKLWDDACAVLDVPDIDIKLPNVLKTCDLFSNENFKGISVFFNVPKDTFTTYNIQIFEKSWLVKILPRKVFRSS